MLFNGIAIKLRKMPMYLLKTSRISENRVLWKSLTFAISKPSFVITDQGIFWGFNGNFSIKTWFSECKISPCIWRPKSGRKYILDLFLIAY